MSMAIATRKEVLHLLSGRIVYYFLLETWEYYALQYLQHSEPFVLLVTTSSFNHAIIGKSCKLLIF
jgi:hypothetical protein